MTLNGGVVAAFVTAAVVAVVVVVVSSLSSSDVLGWLGWKYGVGGGQQAKESELPCLLSG